jgi:hypothetical protein
MARPETRENKHDAAKRGYIQQNAGYRSYDEKHDGGIENEKWKMENAACGQRRFGAFASLTLTGFCALAGRQGIFDGKKRFVET